MHDDGSSRPLDVAAVANGFSALWLAGDFQAAGEKYWAEDVMSIGPCSTSGGEYVVCRGVQAVRARKLLWLTTHAIEDLSLDGPFITGDHFALFLDMLILHAGQRIPHSAIAIFVVRDGKIVEERYFHG